MSYYDLKPNFQILLGENKMKSKQKAKLILLVLGIIFALSTLSTNTYTENQGDCNDSSSSINPGATDTCGDGIDQDCNGSDSVCSNNVDDDGDGYTENQGDCNDYNATIYPGASEICGDRIDQNCDGRDEECSVVDPPDVENGQYLAQGNGSRSPGRLG